MGKPNSGVHVHVVGYGTVSFVPDPDNHSPIRSVPTSDVQSLEEALARVARALGCTRSDLKRAMEAENGL